MGQVAYEAYCKYTDGLSLVSGDKLPPWDRLPRIVQQAWEEAADAVRRQVREQDAAIGGPRDDFR